MQDVRTRHHNYGNRQRNAHWLGCAAGQNAAVRSPLCTSVRAIRVASARDAQLAALIANLGSRSTKFSIGHSITDARSLHACPNLFERVPVLARLGLLLLFFPFFSLYSFFLPLIYTCPYFTRFFYSSGNIFEGRYIYIYIIWKKYWHSLTVVLIKFQNVSQTVSNASHWQNSGKRIRVAAKTEFPSQRCLTNA